MAAEGSSEKQHLILKEQVFPSAERAQLALAGHELTGAMESAIHEFSGSAPLAPMKESFAKNEASFARVDFRLAEAFLHHPWAPVEMVSKLRAVDSLILQNNSLVPRLEWPGIFKSFLVREVQPLHIRDATYIVGSGPLARMSAFVLANLGYRKLRFVGADEGAVAKEVEFLQKVLFGLDLQSIPTREITAKNITGSLLVIGEDLTENKDFKADLAYYNFMANNATVVDLRNWESNNILVEEAHRAGLRAFLPSKFWPHYEWHWVRLSRQPLSYEQFLLAWPL